MIASLTAFVEELRAVGVPVSMVEAIDAAGALQHVDLRRRASVRSALAATLVKSHRHQDAFDVAFDVFFGLLGSWQPSEDEARDQPEQAAGEDGGGSGAGEGSEDLAKALVEALAGRDRDKLYRLVQAAVDRYAGIESGRPVGGTYYFFRVMRQLDRARLAALLLATALQGSDGDDALSRRVAQDQANHSLEELEAGVRREIIRRLVQDRGAVDVARTLRKPLAEDIDLLHATSDQVDELERAIAPLARRLASRLAHRRRMGRRGRLDVRRTIRRSLSHGGALVDPTFRPPRRTKPEIVLLCDVSGSMATFARFTMQLTYAVSGQFSKVRTFAFVDGLDEVTAFFGPGVDFADAMQRMSTEARLVSEDGHSDYGRSLRMLVDRFPTAIGPRTSVIMTGDARTNYRDTRADLFADVTRQARAVYWMNPEAQRYWNTGDSEMARYRPLCDEVHEVRTLRQLEQFVDSLALRPGPRSSRRRLATSLA